MAEIPHFVSGLRIAAMASRSFAGAFLLRTIGHPATSLKCGRAVRGFALPPEQWRLAELPNVDSRNMILIGIRVPLIAERPEKARDDLLANR